MTEMSDTRPAEAGFGDYFALLKPRVMSLVVFTAFVGLMCAPVALHPVEVFSAVLFIALGAGASGALNMWWDADIDAIMRRTQKRPVPAGLVTADAAMALGVGLSILSVMMLTLATNLLAGGLLAFTILYYAVFYTMLLKRRTPQNIVIGGAAGALPPVIGWAAATGTISLESMLMFAVIFLWTPAHSWALALFTKTDYGDAGVPMLTVTHGPQVARRQAFLYTVALAVVTLGLGTMSVAGPVYLVTSIILNARLLQVAWHMRQRSEDTAQADNFSVEKRFFVLTLWYLFLHFAALLIEAVPLVQRIGW
ncbi:MAG: heme o synthase [Deltaproteobacteria bacterium]